MSDPVLETLPLGFPWVCADPFLFCVHHLDHYPQGNEALGPDAPLSGRNIGQDFEGKDGWRMYHGDVVPGFPQHPHRGFETVTIARRGLIDHSDSLGATARFGKGDVQWLTAGAGIVHSEMFPLVNREGDNTLELFQIWLNLPSRSKFVTPYFTMLWDHEIPRHHATDTEGRSVDVTVVAGAFGEQKPPAPPPNSWASQPNADVAIWTLRFDAGARFELPPADSEETVRTLYFFKGPGFRIGGRSFNSPVAARVRSDIPIMLEAGDGECELLMLQGRPIAEPVVQYGPFVMNTREEIQNAIDDYRRTQFGGWPWQSDGPVHDRSDSRFAKHADGHVERQE
ncbi:MAG TPA: pirin family protein [Polyangiaceae bacterium]|nr:pirin family protein [Polyangiaceae bacterium]